MQTFLVRTFLAMLSVILTYTGATFAQTGSVKTQAQLNTEVNTTLPDNTSGLITPLGVRQLQLDLISTMFSGVNANEVHLTSCMNSKYGVNGWTQRTGIGVGTDIQPAIAQCLQNFRSAGGRGTVIIDTGIWLMNSGIAPATLSGNYIIGYGSQASVIVFNNNAGIAFDWSGGGGFTGGGMRGISIELESGIGTTTSYALYGIGTSSAQPDQMEFEDIYITTVGGGTDYWFDCIHFDGTARASPQGIRVHAWKNIQIFQCSNLAVYLANIVQFTIENLGTYSPKPATTGADVQITGGGAANTNSTQVTLVGLAIGGNLNILNSSEIRVMGANVATLTLNSNVTSFRGALTASATSGSPDAATSCYEVNSKLNCGSANFVGGSFQINGVNGVSYPTDKQANASIAIGSNALVNGQAQAASENGNMAVGYFAMGNHALTATAINNIAFGYESLFNLTGDAMAGHGSNNLGIGFESLFNNIVGADNTGVGFTALFNTTGNQNVAVGSGALYDQTSGALNTALGFQAGNHSTGSNNVIVGYEAGLGVLTTSTYANTTLVGFEAGLALTTGGSNICIGYLACANTTTGGSNIIIGPSINTPAVGTSNYLNIGGGIISTNIGATAQIDLPGALQVGSGTNATLATGEVGFAKIAASGSAPGAGFAKIEAVAGTMAGTCKLIAYAGTSTTPTTILDNIGSGC